MSHSDNSNLHRHGSWPPATDAKPIPPSSWAKKTGFKPKFSGETNATDSGQINRLSPKPTESERQLDLEAGRVRPPVNGVVHNNNVTVSVPAAPATAPVPVAKDQVAKKRRDSDGVPSTNGQANPAPVTEQPRRTARFEEVLDGLVVNDEEFASRHAHMKYELRDFPGLGISWNFCRIFEFFDFDDFPSFFFQLSVSNFENFAVF